MKRQAVRVGHPGLTVIKRAPASSDAKTEILNPAGTTRSASGDNADDVDAAGHVIHGYSQLTVSGFQFPVKKFRTSSR